MRSFVSQSSTSALDSFGDSEDMVDYFDCLDALEIETERRIYELTVKSTFNADKFKTLAGKGLILKNIDLDKSIAFGIFHRHDDEHLLIQTSRDITALCQDTDRLSVLFFSDLSLTSKTMYAFYQPLNKSLLKTLDTTSINVDLEDLDSQWVT